MRYEKPELALLGEAEAVVLGCEFGVPETLETSACSELVGYDE